MSTNKLDSVTNKKLSSIKIYHYIMLFIAGGISVFAYSPFDFKFVIVLSLLVLLHKIYGFNKQTTKRTAFLSGFVYGVSFFGSQLYWMFYSLYVVIDVGIIISVIAFISFILFLAVYIGLFTLFFSRIQSSSRIFNLLFLLPSIWTLSEWFRGWFLTGFSWSDVSYTQVSTGFLKGIYPIFGSYAVSWILIAITSGIYILINSFLYNKLPNSKKESRIALLFIMIAVLGGTLVQNKSYTQIYGKPVTVALIQGDVAQSAKWVNNSFMEVYKNLIEKAKADIVIIPETAISTFSKYLPNGYLDSLTMIAKQNNSSLIVGIPKIIDKEDNYVNAAELLTSPSHPYYAKYHLVPYGEYIPAKWILGEVYKAISLPMVGFSAGKEVQPPLVAANQKLAFNICYENGFNSELIKNAKDATIMANLSDMVWYGKTIAKDEHLQISQARALENQRYFIQVTNTGSTAIIKPQGEIQSSLPAFKGGILTDKVYGRFGYTPFEKFGNFPIIIWCGLILLFAIINRKYKFFGSV